MKIFYINYSVNKLKMFLAVILLMMAISHKATSQTAIPNPVCYGNPIYLFCDLPGCGTPGATYQWTNSGSWTSSDPNPVIYPGNTGYGTDTFHLTVYYSPPPGGQSTGSVLVTVVPLPVPVISGPAVACLNSTGNVYSTQTGMTNYLWTVTGGTITAGGTSTSNTITVTWNTTGSKAVTVKYTNASGCTAPVPTTYNVIVDSPVAVSVAISASANPVCAGNFVTYTAIPDNGGGIPVYQWKVNGITAPGATSSTYTYTPLNNDQVKCILTSSATCATGNPATSNTVFMTVNPLPVVTLTGPSSVCPGSAGNLYYTEAGMSGYSWIVSSGGSMAPGSGANTTLMTESFETGSGTVPPAGWAVEQVSGTTLGISFETASTNPTINAAYNGTKFVKYNSYSISSGSTRLKRTTAISTANMFNIVMVDFAWYEDPGYTASYDRVDVQWSTNGVVWNTAGSFNRYNPVPGWKVKNVALPSGASNQASLYVAFLFTTHYGNNCDLDFAHVTVKNNTIVVNWNSPGAQSVSVNYTNGNGCAAPIPLAMPVSVFPVFSAGTISPSQTISTGTAPVMLTGIAPSGGSGPYSYQWQKSTDMVNFPNISGATNLNYQPGTLTATTYYRLQQTSSFGCGSALTNVATITVDPLLPVQVVVGNNTIGSGQTTCYNASQTITVAGSGTTFKVLNGGFVTMIAGQTIRYLAGTQVQPGGYMHGYIAQNYQYCSQLDSPVVMSYGTRDYPQMDAENSFFTVYPNPTSGGFSLEIKGISETDKLNVELYGMHGERLLSAALQGQRKYDFSLEDKPAGVYFIRAVSGKFAGTRKIIKQ